MAQKKKKVRETGDYVVTVKDNSPAASEPVKATQVKAASPDQAVSSATRGDVNDPNAEITISKAKPAGAQNPNVQAFESVTVNVKAVTEAAQYPYTMFLTTVAGRFLKEQSLPHTSVGSGYSMIFETKTELGKFLRKLNRIDELRANAILLGIRESVGAS